ncbi:acyl-CoA carboxylase biotin carboxyl carrier protein subunit [Verminephrobacter eiseniae]|uniref:acetyl-CoA carboxylase biotin carboxyl carrier protein subunit n=1 Tax=Verminephrobacter eiseniae TaxID=364317 RepID=UPI0022433CCA|nr:acetyl-CoA carboxylase biotin carboxyl carrier protein subunit [Verminephrobacter eiseniae]
MIALPVKSGGRVEANQPLVVMESMKMEMPLCAPGAGVVGQILVEVGSQLSAGQVLMELVAE